MAGMKILLVHNNFPGQFRHLAKALAARGHDVQAIGGHPARGMPGIDMHKYRQDRLAGKDTYVFADKFEEDCLRGVGASAVAIELGKRGYRPDVIVGHPGWGEMMFLPDVWPNAKVVAYAEYANNAESSYVGFDPEFGARSTFSDMHLRARDAATLMTLAAADVLISPTEWQRNLHPEYLRSRINVVHDGIDTETARPRDGGQVQIPLGPLLTADDEVVTYVNRHLEPLRGMHIFLRSLPGILAARPRCHVIIIGSHAGVPYFAPPEGGKTWKDLLLGEVGDRIDMSRVHWLGWVDSDLFRAALSVSRAHVYLTYPFVLSWSVLEAMSAGCTVIASSTEPVREIIEDGKHGILVDFFDIAGLTEKVIDVLSRPRDAFADMQANARQRVIARYDRAICMPRLVGLIEGATAMSSARPADLHQS